jgi:hypothetical protein
LIHPLTRRDQFAVVPDPSALPALEAQPTKIGHRLFELGPYIDLGCLQHLYLGRALHRSGSLIARLVYTVLCSIK